MEERTVLKNIEMFANIQSIPVFGQATPIEISRSYEIRLELITESQKVLEYYSNLLRGGYKVPPTMGLHLQDQEWMCIYCHVPNPLAHVICSQCGAPRGFILRS